MPAAAPEPNGVHTDHAVSSEHAADDESHNRRKYWNFPTQMCLGQFLFPERPGRPDNARRFVWCCGLRQALEQGQPRWVTYHQVYTSSRW